MMRTIPRKYLVLLALIVAVILSVLLFVKYNGGNEAEIEILIGRPVEASETAVDFTHSPKLSKKTANNILLALLSGKSLPDQAAPTMPPAAIIMIQSDGVAYMYSAWVDESDLIYAIQTDDEATDYRVASLSGDELDFFEGIHA